MGYYFHYIEDMKIPVFLENDDSYQEIYIVLPIEFYGYRFSEEAIARKEDYIEDTLKGIRENIKLLRKIKYISLRKHYWAG